MQLIRVLCLPLLMSLPLLAAHAGPLVFAGNKGPGQGKHILFIASDHEYRSEEAHRAGGEVASP